MRIKKLLVLSSLVLFVLMFSLAFTRGALGYYPLPLPGIRMLASWYLYTTLNPQYTKFTAMSPEAVAAILWDYRGLDTLFETAVFFLAIVSALTLMRGITLKSVLDYASNKDGNYGLSLISKTAAKLLTPLIIVVSASILYEHLLPGGGFQGGSAAAVAPLLVLVIFSVYFLLSKGVSEKPMLMLITAGLIGIYLTALAAVFIGLLTGLNAYVFQNQPKFDAPVGLPAKISDTLISGSLLFFNIFEYLAVAGGFTLVFILLSVPEEVVKSFISGETYE
ncbi:MAG: Na(+)/H(+) antiporter subunit B [Desulfurococcaceae archaeon TW002]